MDWLISQGPFVVFGFVAIVAYLIYRICDWFLPNN